MIHRALLVLMLVLGSAVAQTTPPQGVSADDAAAIRSTITRQLDAFRRDDAPSAYGFAAPNVREVFPTADGFIDMVRRFYQPVHRARDAEFSELAMRDGALVQEVELVGADGRPVLALYTMVRDGQGVWKIAACVLIPSIRVGA